MNYQLIKILCKRRGMTETKLIGFTGMSIPGYYLMLKKQPGSCFCKNKDL